jgi:hypothetical protein
MTNRHPDDVNTKVVKAITKWQAHFYHPTNGRGLSFLFDTHAEALVFVLDPAARMAAKTEMEDDIKWSR